MKFRTLGSACKKFLKRAYNHFRRRYHEIMNAKQTSLPLQDTDRRNPVLYVDITELHRTDAGTGIQRVVRNILANIYDEHLACRIIEIYSKDDGTGFLTCAGDLPVLFIKDDVFFCLDFSPSATPANAGNFALLHNLGVKIWFFIHDLIPVRFPETCGEGMSMAFRAWLKVICRYDGIIGNSKSTIDDLRCWLKENPDVTYNKKIELEYVHLGSDFAGKRIDNTTIHNAEPVILMVSTVEPRKCYEQAVQAFEQLWEEGVKVKLHIVGRPGWNNEKTIKMIEESPYLNRELFWYNTGISDEELAEQYRNCDAVLVTSKAEGFGLAVVEGAAYHKPLILRDIAVFREIAGDNASYFSGFEPEALAESIKDWLGLYRAEKAPTSEKLRLYTWKECTHELLRFLGE